MKKIPLLSTAETGATYEIWERMADFERLHVKLKPGIDQKAALRSLKAVVVHPENYFLMERRNGKYKEVAE